MGGNGGGGGVGFGGGGDGGDGLQRRNVLDASSSDYMAGTSALRNYRHAPTEQEPDALSKACSIYLGVHMALIGILHT